VDPAIPPGWGDVHAGQAMSAALGHHVEIENDANLGALGEGMWGAGRGADNLVYLKVASGIGRPGGTAGQLREQLTLAEAISRALAGDPGCKRALADSGRSIGAGLATLCTLLNPTRIVVGGELSTAGALLMDPLKESLARGATHSAANDVEVVEGDLGERAQVLGAIALTLRQPA
jgi:predicted NBD/HSP70 family sugar kinase